MGGGPAGTSVGRGAGSYWTPVQWDRHLRLGHRAGGREEGSAGRLVTSSTWHKGPGHAKVQREDGA